MTFSLGIRRCPPLTKSRSFKVRTAEELDSEVRDLLALGLVGRGHEVPEIVYMDYTDEAIKEASALSQLTAHGIRVVWHKQS